MFYRNGSGVMPDIETAIKAERNRIVESLKKIKAPHVGGQWHATPDAVERAFNEFLSKIIGAINA